MTLERIKKDLERIKKELGLAGLAALLKSDVISGDPPEHRELSGAGVGISPTIEHPKIGESTLVHRSNTLYEEKIGHHVIDISGPTRLGKSTIGDIVEQTRGDIERGLKYKHRLIGKSWPEDNKKKSSMLAPRKQLDEWEKIGKVPFQYNTVDTIHAPDTEDMLRPGKHRLYTSDSHTGTMKFKQYLSTLPQYDRDPLTFLFYTSPEIIEARLKNSRTMSDAQIQARLRTFEPERAHFLQNTAEYLFLMNIKHPPIERTMFLDTVARQQKVKELSEEAARASSLIDEYLRIFPKEKRYGDIHRFYLDERVQRLLGIKIGDLTGRLGDEPIDVDLTQELEAYSKGRHVPREIQRAVTSEGSVKAVKYGFENRRHTILLEGFVRPDDSEPDEFPEDVVLDLIAMRLGVPIERQTIKGQTHSKRSDLGLFKLLFNGGWVKSGALYSLGEPAVDGVHDALHIGFVYPQAQLQFFYRQPIQMIGYSDWEASKIKSTR